MFPARAFAPRYFAGRYWPKVGAAAVVVAPAPSGGAYLLRRPPRVERELVSLILSRGVGVARVSTVHLEVVRQIEALAVAPVLTTELAGAVAMFPVLAGAQGPVKAHISWGVYSIARMRREVEDMEDLKLLGLEW